MYSVVRWSVLYVNYVHVANSAVQVLIALLTFCLLVLSVIQSGAFEVSVVDLSFISFLSVFILLVLGFCC